MYERLETKEGEYFMFKIAKAWERKRQDLGPVKFIKDTDGHVLVKEHITIEWQMVPQVTKFKYLGSFVQSDGKLDNDVVHRVQIGWCRWRAATGVLCDRRFQTKLKGKFYRVEIRPAMLYGADYWAIKKAQEQKMEVAKMRMLHWMYGHTRLDRIRNSVFRERLGVANISDKIRE
ncbi:uncharacterized protein LOC143568676 [Bidens hawaiensis]|uniref:uncharacterized protein LOC143568676 n=1 Tax=Bidens hawaiensis TaxID=980011 RepID=UPI0040498430